MMSPNLRTTLVAALLAAVPGTAFAEKTPIVPLPRSEKPGEVRDDAKRQYCANMRSGASTFNHQVCHTRAQWSAQGVEVSAAAPFAAAQVAGKDD